MKHRARWQALTLAFGLSQLHVLGISGDTGKAAHLFDTCDIETHSWHDDISLLQVGIRSSKQPPVSPVPPMPTGVQAVGVPQSYYAAGVPQVSPRGVQTIVQGP